MIAQNNRVASKYSMKILKLELSATAIFIEEYLPIGTSNLETS
jgi:hypothetical protein